MDVEGILRRSAVGCWAFLDGAIEWDATVLAIYDRAVAPADYDEYLSTVHPDDRDRVAANVDRFMIDGVYEDLEHRVIHGDGSVRWVFARGQALRGEDGAVRGLAGVAMDVTERKEREQRLAREATSDELTGLRNRRWLAQELPRELARAARHKSSVSLIVGDVNAFKAINDGPGGHEAGDNVLIALAERLAGALRASDALVRYGGDEFVALLPQCGRPEALEVARRMVQATAESPVAGYEVTLSAGVSTSRPDDDARMLIRRADRSMYRAKDRRSGITGSVRMPED